MTCIIRHSWRDNSTSIWWYCVTVTEVRSTWCTTNDTHTLFPVHAGSDEMTICSPWVNISVFRHRCLCLLWSNFWGDFNIDQMPQPLHSTIYFHCGSCFEHFLTWTRVVRSIIKLWICCSLLWCLKAGWSPYNISIAIFSVCALSNSRYTLAFRVSFHEMH